MSKRVNFDKVIDGKDYLVNEKTGNKRAYSCNKKYLHVDDSTESLIGEVRIHNKQLPTLDSLFGCKDLKGFIDILRNIYTTQLGFDEKTFNDNIKKDPPILHRLYPEWRKSRDPNWLYNLDEYAFETLHCNLYVTIKAHSKGSTDNFATVKNTISHMEILEFDKKESFKVLDLCSGMGLSTLMIAKHFPNAIVYYNELNKASRTVFKELLTISGLTNVVILNHEEVDFDLDLILGFEAVEHIPHPTLKGVGQPMEWLQKFLDYLKKDGYFMYETMWNAEWSLNGDVLGHFLEYEMDGVIYGKDPNKRHAEFHKHFQNCLKTRNILRVDGKTSLGYNNMKWGFRGGPKVYRKI